MVDDAIPPDDVLDVLDAAVQLLDDEAGAFPAVAERARLLRERRAAGWTYTEIMTSGGGLSVIEGRAAAAAAHSATASRLRRAAALALRNEGLSTDRIAQLLQVSRQRISALLRSSGRWQAPTDDRPGRRHARELALTDQEYGLIAESIPHLVFVAAPDGSVCSINTRWSQYTGIKRETTHGWNWSMFLHPDDVEDALSNWRHAILTETAYSVECRVRAANGQFTWHAVRALPIRGHGGRVLRWLGTATAIDDRRHLAGDTRAAHQDIAEAISKAEPRQGSVPIAVAFADIELRVTRMNQGMVALSGVPSGERIGGPVAGLVAAIGSDLDRSCRQVLATGRPVLNEVQVDVTTEPAGRHDVLAVCYPARLEDTIVAVGILLVDITGAAADLLPRRRPNSLEAPDVM